MNTTTETETKKAVTLDGRTCEQLAELLSNQPEGKESKAIRQAREELKPNDVALIRRLGDYGARSWRTGVRIAKTTLNLPRGKLEFGRGPRITESTPEFTPILKSIGERLGLKVEMLNGKAFILES